ncbi:MAG: hypothetical protein ACQETH_04425 [Candidatus Rifleibacteriota bacterium]
MKSSLTERFNRRYLSVLLITFCLLTVSLSAIEVEPGRESSYFYRSRIRPFDSRFMGGGILADGMDIRRVQEHHDKPEAQIAVWMPMVEPEPIVKNNANEITDSALIYRNEGSTRDKFPYVVKDKDSDKFYVYRNVKYHWAFENPEEDKKVLAEGNKGGASGGEVYSPFMNLREANATYFEDLVKGNATEEDIWDKKMFVNRHTAPFDSGIAGAKMVSGSTMLQQVGMIMTYERAQVSGLTTSGPGYPETAQDTADPAGELPGTVSLNSEPADSEFENFGPEDTIQPIPDALKHTWNLSITIDGKTYNEFTDYNVVYVEDYSYPEVSQDFLDPKGQVYNGVVGKYVGYQTGENMSVSYENENADLLPTSPAISSAFDYFFSADELYHMPNPFYDGSPSKQPVLFFYALKSNGAYGPYVGVCSPDFERDYYVDHHPFWKNQSSEELEEFLANRYANAWDANFFKPWEKGVVYYVLYQNGDGETRVNDLNEAWKNSDLGELDVLADLENELDGITTPEAAEAREAIDALKDFLISSDEGTREATRFAHIGFSAHNGRCGIAKITLENIESQHEEEVVKQFDPEAGKEVEVKKGSWTVAGKRFILPRHFATNSIEWNDQCADAPASQKTQEMVNYYNDLKNMPPDCLMTQEVSNCCGNAAPAGSLVKVEDTAEFSKPLVDCEVEDMTNGYTHEIGVPPIESLDAGSQLVAKDKATGAVTNYGEEGVNEDFDMAGKDWFVVKADGSEEQLSEIPTDPEGADKHKIPVEDQRMKFVIKPYDNIDSLTPFRGVVRTEVEIEALDKNKSPTGNLERIEYEESGQILASNKIVKDGTGMNKYELNKFDPGVEFYHIFRAPGWYQFRVKAHDRAKDGAAGQAREMKFNINVLPAGFKTRSIDR